jgi:hypothetical protein
MPPPPAGHGTDGEWGWGQCGHTPAGGEARTEGEEVEVVEVVVVGEGETVAFVVV